MKYGLVMWGNGRGQVYRKQGKDRRGEIVMPDVSRGPINLTYQGWQLVEQETDINKIRLVIFDPQGKATLVTDVFCKHTLSAVTASAFFKAYVESENHKYIVRAAA